MSLDWRTPTGELRSSLEPPTPQPDSWDLAGETGRWHSSVPISDQRLQNLGARVRQVSDKADRQVRKAKRGARVARRLLSRRGVKIDNGPPPEQREEGYMRHASADPWAVSAQPEAEGESE